MMLPKDMQVKTKDIAQLRKKGLYNSTTDLPTSYKNNDVQHIFLEKNLPEPIKEEEKKKTKRGLSKETTNLDAYNATLDLYTDLVTLGKILTEGFSEKRAKGIDTSIVPFLVASKIDRNFEGEVATTNQSLYQDNKDLLSYGKKLDNILIEEKDLEVLGLDRDKTTVSVNPSIQLEETLAKYISVEKGDVAILLREEVGKPYAKKAMIKALQYKTFLNKARYKSAEIKSIKRDDNQYSFVVCGKN